MPEKKKHNVSRDAVIAGIYSGRYNAMSLPSDLYFSTAQVLHSGVEQTEITSSALAKELKGNIYRFSAAKTFNQTLEMSDSLVNDEGKKLSFTEFKEAATEIYKRYNGEEFDGDPRTMDGWLKTEYNTAVGQARQANKWSEVEKNKDKFPLLMYKTTEGENVCGICGPLDGIILPADDSFWDQNYPENHFGCFCTVIQMDEDTANEHGGEDDPEDIEKYVTASHENKNPLFNNNVGKSGQIFKDEGRYKHPYFQVPLKYKEFAKTNFNLPIE